MANDKLEKIAAELLSRFNLALYQLKRSHLMLWEKQFYAERLGLSVGDFNEVLDYIKSGQYQSLNKKK